MTYLEFIEFFGDEVEVMEDFVGLEDTAIELGYPVSGNVDDQDIQW